MRSLLGTGAMVFAVIMLPTGCATTRAPRHVDAAPVQADADAVIFVKGMG